MKKLSILLPFILAGCATSGNSVKDHYLLDVFDTPKGHAEVASRISDMAQVCDSGIFTVETKHLNTIGQSTVSFKNKHANHYYMQIEVEELKPKKSKVSVYHYMNTDVTKGMAQAIENWVVNDSKQCVRGF